MSDEGLLIGDAALYQNVLCDASKTYTCAAGLADGTVVLGNGVGTTSFGDYNKVWCGPLDSGDGIYFRLNFINAGQAYIWAALYEGSYTADTLPKYVPKGYAAELAECQRYFRILPKIMEAKVTSSTAVMAEVALMPPMRIAPTISITSVGNVYTTNGTRPGNGSYAATATTERAGYYFYAEDITVGTPAVVNDVVGTLSADL